MTESYKPKAGDLVEIDAFVATGHVASDLLTDTGIVVEQVEGSIYTNVFWQKRSKYYEYCPTSYLRLVKKDYDEENGNTQGEVSKKD